MHMFRFTILVVAISLAFSGYAAETGKCQVTGSAGGQTITLKGIDKSAYGSDVNSDYGYCLVYEAGFSMDCASHKNEEPRLRYEATVKGEFLCKSGCTSKSVAKFIMSCSG